MTLVFMEQTPREGRDGWNSDSFNPAQNAKLPGLG
jgi:hypothetical protein